VHPYGVGGPRRDNCGIDARRRSLRLVLVANGGFLAAEVVGGVLFGSLALLADASHMLLDVVAIALAYWALRLAQRPPTDRHTFGFARTEVLAAQANAVLLLVSSVIVTFEAIRRFDDPHDVATGGVIAIGAGGLLINLVSARALSHHAHDNMNMRGAFWHLVADALGSIAVVVAGIGVALFGTEWLDPAASLFIALLVCVGAVRLLRDTAQVLLERVPANLDAGAVRDALEAEPGVDAVHHLHVWTTGSEHAALSAHVVLGGPMSLHDAQQRAGELKQMLAREFGISHATLEVECHACVDDVVHQQAADASRQHSH
jgi:cobalt-zinc-cadmium efflux system protein